MTYSKRFKANLIYFVSMLSLLVVRIVASTDALDNLPGGVSRSAAFSLLTQIVCMGVIPVCGYLILITKRGSRLKTTGDDFCIKKIIPKNFVEIAVITVATIYVTTCVSSVWQQGLRLLGFRSSGSNASSTATAWYVIGQVLLVAVLPAICEELTNRGINRAAFSDDKTYVFISAVLFALMHQNVTQTGYTFVAGLVMAGLCVCTGSIWAAVIFHFVNNFVSVMRLYVPAFGFLNKFFGVALGAGIGGALGAVLFVFCVALIVLCFNRLKSRLPKPLPRYTVTEFCSYFNYSKTKPQKSDDLFLWLTVAMNFAATVFSFVWGLLR